MLVASITLNILGVQHYLDQSGTGLNLTSLLIFCAVFGMSGSVVSLLLSKTMAKWSAKVKLIEHANTSQEQWLYSTVERLAQQAGIGMPDVGVFPSQQSNAFATGWTKNHALVAVSAGLLRTMNRQQVEAVLAHEIGHVANGDMVTLSLLQGVINTFVMFFARIIGTAIDRLVFKNQRSGGIGYYMMVMMIEMVLAVFASMIVMWFSRFREYRADAAGAALTSPQAMISALEALQREYEQPSLNETQKQTDMPEAMQAFGISPGFKRSMGKAFASHPPLALRIAALKTIQG
jgi:heat shock protein HtpX